MARYHGRRGTFYMQGSGAEAVPSISMSEWVLDVKRDRVDVTAFGDANKVTVQGLPSFEGTFSGAWDDTDDLLWVATEALSGRKVYLYPSIDAPTKYWYGLAWIDANLTVTVHGAVLKKGTFAAAGSWTRAF